MNNQEKKIKIGIVGAGWVANNRHIPAFKSDRRCSIVAIYDTTLEKAEKTAKKYKIKNIFSDYNSFLNSEIDAVVVCTPPMCHASVAKEALLRNKHVLVEKPFSLTIADGKEIENIAKSNGLILFPGHNFLFSRAMLKIKEELKKPDTGDILHVSGYQWSSWMRHLPTWFPELPGSLFFDEGPHFMYLMKYLVGDFSVTSATYTKKEAGMKRPFENYVVSVKGERATGDFSMFFGSPMSEWLIVIMCQKKTLVYDMFRDFYFTFNPELKRTRMYPISVVASFDRQVWKQYIKWIFRRYAIFKRHLYGADVIARKFLDAITGKSEPILHPSDGYQAVEKIIEIIKKSGTNLYEV